MINLKIIKDAGFAGKASPPDAGRPVNKGKGKGGIKGGGKKGASGTPLTQSELTGYWQLDADSNDDHSTYHFANGTTPTFGVSGLTGNCSSWAGTNQYRYGAAGTYWDPGTHNTMSLNIWCYPDTVSPATANYFAQHNTGSTDGFRWYMDTDGAPKFNVWDSGNNSKLAVGPVLTVSQWNMVTVVLDPSGAGTVTVYTNGVAGTPVAITSLDVPRSTNSVLSNSANSWDGLLEDLSFYRGIWTQDNITWMFNGGAGRSYADYSA